MLTMQRLVNIDSRCWFISAIFCSIVGLLRADDFGVGVAALDLRAGDVIAGGVGVVIVGVATVGVASVGVAAAGFPLLVMLPARCCSNSACLS